MGTTYSNCQVRSDSQEAVVEALHGLLKEPAYVAPAVNGWVGVYPECGMMDPDGISKSLSTDLSLPVMYSMVHDSDVFCYSLYESGTLRDEFNSDPDWGIDPDDDFSSLPTDEERARMRGNPQALLPYCLPGVSASQINAVLHPAEASEAARELITYIYKDRYLFADDQARDLAKLLGMDETLATRDYKYIEVEETDEYTLEAFHLVKPDVTKSKAAPQITSKSSLHQKVNADSTLRDDFGVPYLIKLSRSCLPESVQELLSLGDDVNIALDTNTGVEYTWEVGTTALIAAAGASTEHPTQQLETIRLLLDAGADVNARTETGRTALSEALRLSDPSQHIGKIRYRASEDVLRQAAERSAQVVEMLRAAGATE